MIDAYVRAYPFDFTVDGVAPVLDQLQGQLGLSGVSVWAASAPVARLCIRSRSPGVCRSRGGIFFQTHDEYYQATRCKPIASSRVKGSDPLARIAEQCADRKMNLRAVVSASRIGRMAQRYTDAAAKSAFGDSSHTGLCLAHPDVRAMLCGLLADLTSNHKLSGVVLADFQIAWPDARVRGVETAAPLRDVESFLLSTCFCESCQQGATTDGVDVAAARRSVQVILKGSLAAGRGDLTLQAVTADNRPLAAYSQWRDRALTALLKAVTDVCQCDVVIEEALDPAPLSSADESGKSLPYAVLARMGSSAALPLFSRLGDCRKEIVIPIGLTLGPRGPELVGTLARAAESDISAVEFDDYALLPEAALTSIKQAVRFARRTGDA